jgi:coenzyme F420 hydrogenase subunit beta
VGRIRMNCLDLKASVLDKDLCCGCGGCVGVCPTGALTIEISRSHEPGIDQSKCTECGLCTDICPGKGYNIAGEPVEDGAGIFADAERGPIVECLAGHSTDPDIRACSASGGIATSLLIHMLESGRVDSVMVVGMKDERPEAVLTEDKENIESSTGSKYGPVPVLAELIPALMKRPRRVAATFTPCQLAGWRMASERIPVLRNSEVIAVGLFCGYVQRYEALSSIAATLGLVYPGEARFKGWRCGPYPGSIRFEHSDGTAADKPLYRWLDIAVPHFSLHRCLLCPDGGNWRADVVLGDIHSGGNDETVIVCRTERGKEMVESACAAGRISTRELTPAQIERSVIRHISRSKMLPAISSISWLGDRGRAVPRFDYDGASLLVGRKPMRIFWVWKYRIILWFRRGRQRRYLLEHPALMEKVGHFLYNLPGSLPGWKLLIGGRELLKRLAVKDDRDELR